MNTAYKLGRSCNFRGMTAGGAWLLFVPKYDESVAPSLVISEKLQFREIAIPVRSICICGASIDIYRINSVCVCVCVCVCWVPKSSMASMSQMSDS